MKRTDPDTIKRHGGTDWKPAVVRKIDGEVICASHHFTSDGWLCLYESRNPDRVLRKIPRERIDEVRPVRPGQAGMMTTNRGDE